MGVLASEQVVLKESDAMTHYERKSIGKRLRFSILERDGFRCGYCGASAPDVILHVDHVTPITSGGTNDLDNLVASCAACNFGKTNKELSDEAKYEIDFLYKQRSFWNELVTQKANDVYEILCRLWTKKTSAEIPLAFDDIDTLFREYIPSLTVRAMQDTARDVAHGKCPNEREAVLENISLSVAICHA